MNRLEDHDPPQETSPGYYPDPLGGEFQRWWDGTSWTYKVGPKTGRAPDKAERIRSGIENFAGLTATTLVLLLLNGSFLTKVAVAIVAGLIAGYSVRFFFWLNADRRPDPSGPRDS